MTEPELSICIATFNRAQYIGQTLDSIIPQLADNVELLIVDGASTDNTENVVKDYVRKDPRIRYVRLPQKGGVDQDFDKTVELARGIYCWLFTDDDLLKPNAIATVLNEIKKDFSLMIVNAEVKSTDLSEVITNQLLQIDTDEKYKNSEFDQLFQRIIPYVSFIGCVIIKRDIWMQRERKKYFGTEFIHVGVIFQSLLPTSALVISDTLITIRLGNAQWMTRSFEIWMYKWPGLISSFLKISEPLRQEFKKTYSWHNFKRLIVHRAKREFTLNEFNKWILHGDSPIWWKIAALCIAVFPCEVLRFAVTSYLKFANKEALKWWTC